MKKYRKHLSHHVMHAVNNRIDVHMEIENSSPNGNPSLLQKIRILKYKGGFIPPFYVLMIRGVHYGKINNA